MNFFKSVFPGKYLQGENAINELPALIQLCGTKAMILITASGEERHLPAIKKTLPPDTIIIHFNGECCETEIQRVYDAALQAGSEVIVGIGGGKTIDTAKIVADRLNGQIIIVPTIASTDAPCSACAVVYSEEGVVQKVYYQKRNPDIVLMDSAIISRAPVRFLVSGMGDALATWFEAKSCHRTQSLSECGGLSTQAGLALAKLCYQIILADGLQAKIVCEQQVVTPALERVIEANTLLSGLGFESSGLAAAHSIHNGLTVLPGTHSYYHGEKVAFGLIASLHLTGESYSEIDKIYNFCEHVGLPTTFEAIGISDCSPEDLTKVAKRACSPGECIHHEAGEIRYQQIVAALIMANACGVKRRCFS